jgi:hypothetical protein
VRANAKTNAAQAPVRPRTRRRGGQPGNRNAAKPVHPLSALKARIRDFNRRVRAALRQADENENAGTRRGPG